MESAKAELLWLTLLVVGTGFWADVGNGPLGRGQAGHRLPAGGDEHQVWELGMVVSCGDSGERGWRAELELGGGKSLDHHHGPATVGTEPERSGFLGGGCFWLGLRLNHWEGLPAKWQESGPPPVGEKAEVANADEAFGEQVQQEAAQELIER